MLEEVNLVIDKSQVLKYIVLCLTIPCLGVLPLVLLFINIFSYDVKGIDQCCPIDFLWK